MLPVRPCGHRLIIPRSSRRLQRPFAAKLQLRGTSPTFTLTSTGSRTTLPTLIFLPAAGAYGLPNIGMEAVMMNALALPPTPLLNMIAGSILPVVVFPT